MCLDENFQPVVTHDVTASTMELHHTFDGGEQFRCLLCGAVEIVETI